jgi:hypothetical protein
MVRLSVSVDARDVHPDDPVLHGARRELVARLLVEQDDREPDGVSRYGFPDVRVDAELDRAADLARIMGAVEEVLAGVGIGVAHGRRLRRRVGHVAVVAFDALLAVGPVLPFELGGFDPGAEGAHFVVACPAELRRAEEVGLGHDVLGRVVSLARPVFGFPGLGDPVIIVRDVAGEARDRVADFAGDGLVGPAPLQG